MNRKASGAIRPWMTTSFHPYRYRRSRRGCDPAQATGDWLGAMGAERKQGAKALAIKSSQAGNACVRPLLTMS